MRPPRTYRHWPWRAGLTFLALLALVSIAQLVVTAVQHPSFDRVVGTFIVVVFLTIAEVFYVLSWRVRTVVDDAGVTQHWIWRSYRITYPGISEIELHHTLRCWYLRVRCGEHTFMIIPCQTFLGYQLSSAIGAPRALRAAARDIEDRYSVSVEGMPPATGRS